MVVGGVPYVYLLKGGTNEFYRKNVSAKGSWETLTGAPLPPSGKVYKTGSAIVYYPDDKIGTAASGRIFVLKGSANEFHAFDLLTGGWTDKAPTAADDSAFDQEDQVQGRSRAGVLPASEADTGVEGQQDG